MSRATLGKEIHLGEGAVKTLISHLKEAVMIKSARSGNFLTGKGENLHHSYKKLFQTSARLEKTVLLRIKTIMQSFSKNTLRL